MTGALLAHKKAAHQHLHAACSEVNAKQKNSSKAGQARRHIKQLQVEAASLQALLSRKDAELSRIEAEREARAKADALATSKRAARAAQSANRLQAAQRELAGARDQLDAATQDAAALRQQLWAAQSEGRSLKSRLEAALAEVQGLKELASAAAASPQRALPLPGALPRQQAPSTVAFVGGKKLKEADVKMLPPGASVRFFGSTKDMGRGELTRLEAALKAGTIQQVYMITRWNGHSVTKHVRRLCRERGIPVFLLDSTQRAGLKGAAAAERNSGSGSGSDTDGGGGTDQEF
ncbi:hypothetical protein MNEG_11490 [Monoraphidium neglectum]|uniref:DUF2325 domain-containing protein n=1 Tax=Monoraphidium neglectum TaxID=145388 RepID=A0A0D2MP35_9CHLO|nr:hypothetical protein MNEG_11490 [Monoraphidium neglectum]KIY96470.1 hypothetical protein MNEG_11490 [Monoraphidium neglectum]|eukprot:XP_013895490.1 hypothetical protein MNEG_11490 [Monoraphidium neglectum]